MAVKAIAGEQVASGRATREARAAARLAHPAIVTLYEAGAEDDTHVPRLGARARRHARASAARGRAVGPRRGGDRDRAVRRRWRTRTRRASCTATSSPRTCSSPTRDRPARRAAKLTDFGVARVVGAGSDALTRTGDVVGTLAYMAPEQAEGKEAGAPADLYATALVLYEALSGVNPVRGGSAVATARKLGATLPPLSPPAARPAAGAVRRDRPRAAAAARRPRHGREPQPRAESGAAGPGRRAGHGRGAGVRACGDRGDAGRGPAARCGVAAASASWRKSPPSWARSTAGRSRTGAATGIRVGRPVPACDPRHGRAVGRRSAPRAGTAAGRPRAARPRRRRPRGAGARNARRRPAAGAAAGGRRARGRDRRAAAAPGLDRDGRRAARLGRRRRRPGRRRRSRAGARMRARRAAAAAAAARPRVVGAVRGAAAGRRAARRRLSGGGGQARTRVAPRRARGARLLDGRAGGAGRARDALLRPRQRDLARDRLGGLAAGRRRRT